MALVNILEKSKSRDKRINLNLPRHPLPLTSTWGVGPTVARGLARLETPATDSWSALPSSALLGVSHPDILPPRHASDSETIHL